LRKADVSSIVCPACQQIKTDYAGGILTLSGSFLSAHREDILNRVRNVESEEKKDHPLQRIMRIIDKGEEIEIRAMSSTSRAHGESLKSDFDESSSSPRGREPPRALEAERKSRI
jgi:hypothetical protein